MGENPVTSAIKNLWIIPFNQNLEFILKIKDFLQQTPVSIQDIGRMNILF